MSKINFSMTEEEIVRSYNQATHKVQQLNTLAELNGCQKKDILHILVFHDDVDLQPLRPGKNQHDEVAEVLFELLDEKDAEAKEIATEAKAIEKEYQAIVNRLRKYYGCES